MQFSTLFLIASAVLAMPTGQSSSVQLAKKDAPPADGTISFPTDNEDNSWNLGKYNEGARKPEDQPSRVSDIPETAEQGKKKGSKRHPFQDAKDNNGNLCIIHNDSLLREMPIDCMKPLFCNKDRAHFKILCRSRKLDTWTVKDWEKIGEGCVRRSICKPEEMYSAWDDL